MPDLKTSLLDMTANVVSAYVSRNPVQSGQLASLIHEVHATFDHLAKPCEHNAPTGAPAVPAAESVKPDHIVCLEDGKKLQMLKRYLRTHYDLSPEEYRQKWNLPADYPMVAPNYAKRRSDLAKANGLGRKA